MRVLVVHNRYQMRGGEDTVFESEVQLLRDGGHEVHTLVEENFTTLSRWSQLKTAAMVSYNSSSKGKIRAAIFECKPDVMHVHNFFPRLTPAIFGAAEELGVPSVWTLHNYRIACANGLLFRDQRPCEKCLETGNPFWGVAHRCYRGSLMGSMAVASMIEIHKRLGTWTSKVSRFIALTEVARGKFVNLGLPEHKVAVKPNFIRDPGTRRDGPRSGMVFCGRLSAEKGVESLLEAWRDLEIPLTILGDGPLRSSLETKAPSFVKFVGTASRRQVFEAMAASRALIIPSIWIENFPMTVVEAMATGTPVIASRTGALGEIVCDGVDGALFESGDASALAAIVEKLYSDPVALSKMGRAARRHYEEKLSPEKNLETLLDIYRQAIEERRPEVGR